MTAQNRLAITSLLLASVFPAVVLLLAVLQPNGIGLLPEPAVVSGVVIVVFLCPLAAAFFGHAARRQIRKNGRESARGYTLAGVGLGLGYLELACAALLLLGTWPYHSNRRGHFEASAVGSLLTINSAEHAYSQAHPQAGYTKRLQDLVGSDSQEGRDWFMDQTLASGVKGHYKFTYVPSSSKQNGVFDRYQAFANPIDREMRHFFTDQTGVIRSTTDGKPANESSTELK